MSLLLEWLSKMGLEGAILHIKKNIFHNKDDTNYYMWTETIGEESTNGGYFIV